MKLTARFVALCGICGVVVAQEVGINFDHLRSSVIRIQSASAAFDWFHPFVSGQDAVSLGSGFVVQTEPYPLFATNEHVINDASHVTLQLLLYGEQQWEADVVSVCSKFDLALLVLRQPQEFKKAMAGRNITIQALELSSQVAAMGEDVVALGFPLGQDSLKISKGNIAGNEEVNGNICIQSTAPISPGNSGGPLLNSEATAVVGVNFAKATEGENINYVIPAWRVTQMVEKHLKDQPKMPVDGKWQRMPVKVPKAELTTIEPNSALYALSGGCDRGVFVSKVGERSLFRNAKPHVPERFFLASVNGRELDRFGMGMNPNYAADRVAFNDLFFMVPDLSADVEFETCADGKVQRHSISMAWRPEYDRGLRYVDEPNIEVTGKAYEMFGDISVMEMTVNHISLILNQLGDPGPARWLHPDFVATPRLVVNFVRSGSYAADVLSVGSVISKVNGHEIHTLKDFRDHLSPDAGNIWTLETDMGKVAALMFKESLTESLAKASLQQFAYLLTPGVERAARILGLMAGPAPAAKETNQLRGKKKVAVVNANFDVDVRKHLSLSEFPSANIVSDVDSGTGGIAAEAAGPVLVQRSSRGGGYTTREVVVEHLDV